MKGRAGLCHPSLMFRTAVAKLAEAIRPRPWERTSTFTYACVTPDALQISTGSCFSTAANFPGNHGEDRAGYPREPLFRHLASCRRKGLPTPTLDEFLKSASLMSHTSWMLEASELIQYRTARIQMASGNQSWEPFAWLFWEYATHLRVPPRRTCNPLVA